MAMMTAATQLVGLPQLMASNARSGIEGVSQPIAQEVDAEDGEQDEKTGEDPHPRLCFEVVVSLVQHVAPGGSGGLNEAYPEESDVGFVQNGSSHPQRGRDDDGGPKTQQRGSLSVAR